jgi:hypothetical protein
MAYHQFKDLVQKKKVQVLYVSTKYQQADILTKVLGTIDLHYSMIKQAYNLQAIVSTNTTLMIKGVNMSSTSVISLEQQIYINYMYVKQSFNPMDERDILDDVKQNLWKTSNKVTTEFTHNDRSFEIKHLVMHASVLSYLITIDASKFPKFFPIVMQENNASFPLYSKHFNEYLSQMKYLVELVNIIRRAAYHLKNQEQYDHIHLSYNMVLNYKTLSTNSLVIQKKNVVNMIRSMVPQNDLNNEHLQFWLRNDVQLTEDLSRYDRLNENEKQILSNKARNNSVNRFHDNEALKHMSYEETIDYHLKNDSTYRTILSCHDELTNN